MAQATVRANLGQALDRLGALAPEISFNLKVRIDELAKLCNLVLGEIANLRVGREAARCADLARARLADAEDVGQPNLEPLRVRQIDAC